MAWTHFDLSDAGAPKAQTIPSAYAFEAFGTQHLIYVAEDGCIWEVLWEHGSWSPHNLTGFTGAPLQPVVDSPLNRPTGYVFASQGTQHVIFVSNDHSQSEAPAGHIHELWWDNTGWHHRDLTSDIGAPLAIVQSPGAYAFETQGTQHVDYVGLDGHINELWWDQDGWHHNDLTNAAGAPLAVPLPATPSPKGYTFQDTQHVVYIGDNGSLHELLWDRSRWGHNPLNVPARSGSPLAAYAFVARGSQHVDYIGADGSVHELSRDSEGIHDDDLIVLAGVTGGPIPSVLCGYVFDAQGTRHVDYTGDSGHVMELWWDDNGWHYNDLTTAASGAPSADQGDPAGYAFEADGTQHVFYIGIGDNHIHELQWAPRGLPVALVHPFMQ